MRLEPRAAWHLTLGIKPHSVRSRQLKYLIVLMILLGLFMMRVVGQLLVACFNVPFLPPMEDWFSGVLSYPVLVTCQLVIVALYGRVCLDFWRGDGYFVDPGMHAAKPLFQFGFLYLGVMIARYVIQMSLYPHERWIGGSLPIFFHWVLACFIIVFSHFHLKLLPEAEFTNGRRSNLYLLASGARWGTIAIGVLLWLAFLLAPSLLAAAFKLRPSQFAVRIETEVVLTATGARTSAIVFRPQHLQKTPILSLQMPAFQAPVDLLLKNVIGRMWAERGYTVIIHNSKDGSQCGETKLRCCANAG